MIQHANKKLKIWVSLHHNFNSFDGASLVVISHKFPQGMNNFT